MLITETLESPPTPPTPSDEPPVASDDFVEKIDIDTDCMLINIDEYSSTPDSTTSDNMSFTPFNRYQQNGNYDGTPTGHVYNGATMASGLPSMPRNSNMVMVPANSVCPGPVSPTIDQLRVANYYGVQLDDGRYVRLFRADELATFDFSSVSIFQSPENMIVLPILPGCREQFVQRSLVDRLPRNRPIRPSVPAHPTSSTNINHLQSQIDSIVASNPAPNLPLMAPRSAPPARRRKVFCDHWVHNGTCHFVQIGCLYKHEMPTDKLTQESLGLFNGFPTWYLKAQAVNLRATSKVSPQSGLLSRPTLREPRASVSATTSQLRPAESSWRHRGDSESSTPRGIEGVGLIAPPSSSVTESAPANYSTPRPGNYGPIARPPPPGYRQPAPQIRPSDQKGSQMDLEVNDGEDEDFVWYGRRGR